MPPDNKITVVIVDDSEYVRSASRTSIKEDDSLELIAEAKNGNEGLEKIVKFKPDVAVIDIELPGMNGLKLSRLVKKQSPTTEIVIITGRHDEEAYFLEAMSIGVSGYVTKDYIGELVAAIKQIREGKEETYVSPKVSKFLTDRYRRRQQLENKTPGIKDLTEREVEILKLVAENKSNKEIAKELNPNIDPRTVETHRNNICKKLNLKGKHSLLVFALQNKHLLTHA